MISVVIPTLNEGAQIDALLDHLSRLDGVGEIIVVDASVPVTAIDRNLSHLQVVVAKKRGRAAQMNQGAQLCKFPMIVFLHSDTQLPDHAPKLISNALDTHQWGRFDIRLDASKIIFRLIESMINLRSRVTRLATGDQAIFIRRDFFDAQGGFQDIALMEDIEFSKRVGEHYPPALISRRVVTSARRWLNHGTLRTIFKMWKIRFLYWRGVHPDQLSALYRDAR